MKSISYAVLHIVVTVALCKLSQPKADGAKAGVPRTAPTNNSTDTRERRPPATDNNASYKQKNVYSSLTSAPAYSRLRNSNGNILADFRNLSSQSIISTSIVDRRLKAEVRILGPVRRNLASFLYHLLMTDVNFETTGNQERWRENTNFEAKLDAKILHRSVTKRNSKVDLYAVLDNALVNDIFMGIQSERRGYIDNGRESHSFSGDRAEATSRNLEGCTSCRRMRRKRDDSVSDSTTRNYISKDTSYPVDTAKNNSTSLLSLQVEAKTTIVAFSDRTHGRELTQEVRNFMSHPPTTSGAEPRDHVPMTTDSLDDVTTNGNKDLDKSTAGENTTFQNLSDEDERNVRGSCSHTSDFGQYGITALAVSLGLVVLLVYVMGVVLVVPRLLERRKLRALHCRDNKRGGPDWLEMGARPLKVDRETEGQITDSYLDLVGLDYSLTSGSDVGQDDTKGEDSHNVSTFLLRRESQQRAEERIAEGKRESHHGNFETTNTMIVTEL